MNSFDPLNILFPLWGWSGRTKLISMCAAVWLVQPACLQSADLCLSPQLSLSGNLRQIIQTNLYVWPLNLRVFTMLIYADCWLCWWFLSDKRGSLVNKIKWREDRQTGQSHAKFPLWGPPLEPPNARSSVTKHWRYQAAFWRPKTRTLIWGDVFPNELCFAWRVSQERAGRHGKWVSEFWPKDCWFFLMDFWWCGNKKNTDWTITEAIFCLCLDGINFSFIKSFMIDSILLKLFHANSPQTVSYLIWVLGYLNSDWQMSLSSGSSNQASSAAHPSRWSSEAGGCSLPACLLQGYWESAQNSARFLPF